MKNGATIVLEASWAVNSLDVDEAKTSLCGTKAGADMKDGLRINRVHHGRQCVEKPDLGAGGVSVAIGEHADGLRVDLDKVPKKYAGLDGTEIAISESQ